MKVCFAIPGMFCLALLMLAPVARADEIAGTAGAQQAADAGQKVLKRKIAIGRFTNETRYGKSLLVDQNLDPLGKQASDILAG